MPIERNVKYISPKEPVSANVTNRAPLAISENLKALQDRVEQARIGSVLALFDKPLGAGCVVGTPVFFNPTTSTFEKALNGVVDDNGTRSGIKNSQVRGVVSNINGVGVGDVVIYGEVEIDLRNLIVNHNPSTPAPKGLYYLSSTIPGKYTLSPSGGVPVLENLGNDRLLVCAQGNNAGVSHTHYVFQLQPQPACTGAVVIDIGNVFDEMTSPSSVLEGWLPADHPTFFGTAPAGAVLGYNLAGSTLAEFWPPTPIEAASLFGALKRGGDFDSIGAIELSGKGGPCVLDANGIWWMSNYADLLPWDYTLDTSGHTEQDYYSQNLGYYPATADPALRLMSLVVYLAKPTYRTDNAQVTSLIGANKVEVKCVNGADGSSGNLVAGLQSDIFTPTASNVAGSLVFKQVDPVDPYSLKKGRVIEGDFTLDINIQITSDLSPVTREIDDVGEVDVYQGLIGLSVNPQQNLRWIEPSLLRLSPGVVEDVINGIDCVGFLPVGGSFTGKMVIPNVGLPSTATVRFVFQIAGSRLGTLPAALTLRYVVVPRGNSTPAALPDLDLGSVLNITLGTALSAAGQYVQVASPSFDVPVGSLVFYRLTRSAGDSYSGYVNVVNQVLEFVTE